MDESLVHVSNPGTWVSGFCIPDYGPCRRRRSDRLSQNFLGRYAMRSHTSLVLLRSDGLLHLDKVARRGIIQRVWSVFRRKPKFRTLYPEPLAPSYCMGSGAD